MNDSLNKVNPPPSLKHIRHTLGGALGLLETALVGINNAVKLEPELAGLYKAALEKISKALAEIDALVASQTEDKHQG